MILLHAFLLAGLIGLFVLLIDNLRHFERLGSVRDGGRGRVSVLVPARDEERSIGACLESLRAQEGVELEIRVLDDGSTDRTAATVQEQAARDPRIGLISGASLPSGWTGKCFACQQLGEAASGEWLLFVDADVRLKPGAIALALAHAEARQADLLTVFPQQETVTLGEKGLIPLLSFILLGFLPFRLLGLPDPRIAAANGQFMLFRQEAYRALGGHGAVRGELVEDIALARAIKRSGYRLAIADGTGHVTCRMYADTRGIWQGFSKNLYPAFGGKAVPFWISMALIASFFLLPWGLVFLEQGRAFALAEIALGLGMRGLLAWRLRQTVWALLGHPAAIGFLLALGLRSFWVAQSGRSVPWKGRTYSH